MGIDNKIAGSFRSALKQRRMFIPVFITFEILCVMAIPFLLINGYHTILGSKAGKFVEDLASEDPNWRQPVDATPVDLVFSSAENGLGDAQIVIGNESGDLVTLIEIPAEVYIGEEKIADSEFDKAVQLIGQELKLSFRDAYQLEPGETINNVSSGVDVYSAPLAPASPGSDQEGEQLSINLDDMETLIRENVKYPVGYLPGDRLHLEILSRSKEVDVTEVVDDLANQGFEVVAIGNASEFVDEPTQIVVPKAIMESDMAEEVRRLASILDCEVIVDNTDDLDISLDVYLGSEILAKS